MGDHRLFGHTIATGLPLTRLWSGAGSLGTIRVVEDRSELLARPGTIVQLHAAGDSTEFAVARFDDGRAGVFCRQTGSYLLDAERGELRTDLATGATPEWEHRLLSYVLPLLLSDRGLLTLHAAAVVHEGRAVLFCGESGRGKTTLALALAEAGLRVLAEDGACVEAGGSGLVHAGPPGFRPISDAASTAGHPARKRTVRLAAQERDAGPVPVGAVVVLGVRGDDLTLERIRPVQAVPLLVAHAHRVGDQGRRLAMSSAVRLCGDVPVFGCRMPDDLARAAEHGRRVLDLVAAEALGV